MRRWRRETRSSSTVKVTSRERPMTTSGKSRTSMRRRSRSWRTTTQLGAREAGTSSSRVSAIVAGEGLSLALTAVSI
jgi:hypothetical protein